MKNSVKKGLIIAAVVVVIVFGYFTYKKYNTPSFPETPAPTEEVQPSEPTK